MRPPPRPTTLFPPRPANSPPAAPITRTLALGDARLDACLPGRGLRLDAVHELLPEARDAEFATAPLAFAALLAGRILARDAAARPVLWAGPVADLYPPGLAALGLDPARLILVRTPAGAETLRAAEAGLRSGAVSVVLAEVAALDFVAVRRLALAAERGGATGLVLRRRAHGAAGVAAATRWQVGSAPSAPSGPSGMEADGEAKRARWRVALLHAKAGRAGAWMLEEGDEPDFMRVVAVLGGDAVCPQPAAGPGGEPAAARRAAG